MLSRLRKIGAVRAVKWAALTLLIAIAFPIAGGSVEAQEGDWQPAITATVTANTDTVDEGGTVNLTGTATGAPSTLYVVDSGGDELWVIGDPDNPGATSTALIRNLPTGLDFPRGLTSAGGNELLTIEDFDEHELWVISDPSNPAGTTSRLSTLPGRLDAFNIASHDNYVWSTNGILNELYRYRRDTGASASRISTHSDVISALVSWEGRLLGFSGTSIVTLQGPDHGIAGQLPSSATDYVFGPGDATVHDGRLLTIDDVGDELWEIDTATATNSILLGSFPAGLAVPTGLHSVPPVYTYSWSSDGGGTFSNATSTNTSWTAPTNIALDTEVNLTLTVSSGGMTTTASTQVIVQDSLLDISDFSDDNLVMDALALFKAGPNHNIFGQAPRTVYGELLAGEVGLGPSHTPITWFRTNAEGDYVNLNDSDGTFAIGSYFATGGDGEDLTMYIQTSNWVQSFAPASITQPGGNFARWDVTDSAIQSRLSGITEGTRVILGFGRPDPIPPAIPAAPTVAASGSTSVLISWDAPSDNGFPITSYDLRLRQQGTASWTDILDLTETTYTATELSPNTTYEAEVSATNEGWDSGYSPTGRGATDAAPPDVPAAPSVRAVSLTSIVISWSAPADNGAAITSYDLRYREQGTSAWTEILDTTATTHTATNLKANTTYEAQVRATNAGGDSDYSEEGTATTGILAPATPAMPSVTAASSTAVVISWSEPADNGSAITSYDLRYREQGTSTWSEVLNLTATMFTAAELKVHTTYEAEVRATNAGGDSAYSPTGSGSTDADRPDIPDPPFVTSASSTALLISWTAPANNGSPITSYDIRYRERGTSQWTDVLDHTTTSYTATQLKTHVTYEAQVSATNSVGDSGHSTSGYGATSPPAIPDIPDRPVLEGVTFDSIRISWTAPAANGARITSYDLRFRELGTSSWTDVEDITTTMHTAANLQATSAYEAEVRATNSVGDSGYSQRGSGTTNPVLTSVLVESYFELPIRIARIEEAATTSGPYTASQVRPFGCVTNAQCLSTPHSTVSLGGSRVYRLAVTFDPISYGSPGEEGVVSVSYVTPTESGWSVLLGLDSFAAGNTSSFTVSPVSYQLSRGDNIQRAVFRLDGGGSGIEAGAEVSWVATFSIQYTDSNPLGNFSLVEIDAGVECDDCTRALTDISGETDRLSPSESLAVVDLGAPETSDAMQIVVVGDMEGFDWPGVSVLRGAAQTAGVEPRLVFAFGGFAALFAVFLLVLKLAQSLIIACIVAGVGMVLFGIPTIGLASTGVIVLFGLIAGAVLLVTKPGVT